MKFIKDNWFKLLVSTLFIVLTIQVSTYLNRKAWSDAYAARSECLESQYMRHGLEDEKSNCFDIIYQFNK